MEDHIFIVNENQLVELNESYFINEKQFQELIEKYPKLISGNLIDPDNPRRWILVSREMRIPCEKGGGSYWSLDHLLIDQDGIPTLIEVKRNIDPRIRREVVAQMLDYAANSVSYWTISDIKNKFEKHCNSNGLIPESEIIDLLGKDTDADTFWRTVESNLETGNIRMIFVSDKIPKELKRIIEFLNQQMNPAEILGIELKQFSNENLKTIVPRIVGNTFNAQNRKTVAGYQWTQESFISEICDKNGKECEKVVNSVINFCLENNLRIWYGNGKSQGSLIPVLDKKIYANQLFAIYTYGRIEIYFQYLKQKPPFNNKDKRLDLLNKLNSIQGINLPSTKLEMRPSFDIRILFRKENVDEFLEILKWIISEINMKQE